MAQPSFKFGWKRDSLDRRDIRYTAPASLSLNLPGHTNNRPNHPPIYDQGALGSCTAFAAKRLVEYLILNGLHDLTPEPWELLSALGPYYDERVIEGTVDWDSGAEIRDGLKVIGKYGIGKESLWPYDIDKFALKPPPEYYADAETRQGLMYAKVLQNECVMKGVLASKLPIIIGFDVYESFQSTATNNTGIVTMPKRGEKKLGGHAVCVADYDEEQVVSPIPDCWIVPNSWGTGVGDKGWYYFPKAYLLDPDLAADFWVLRTIE